MRIVTRDEAISPVVDENGERITELIGAAVALGGLQAHSIVRLELEPGACSPVLPHYHKRAEETYVVLSGSAVISVDGQKHALAAGDIAAVGIGEKHQIAATGDAPLIALAIMAPGFDPNDVFE